ncbi:MAG: hypothetical protein WC045_03215 [Patescibacteria group bacterium]
MKRYRVSNFYINTEGNLLRNLPQGLGPDDVNYQSFVERYGKRDFDQKLQRYLSIENPVLSVVQDHIPLLEEINNSYVAGNFYSCLTAACCLGERIFNDVFFAINGDHKSSDWYRKYWNKGVIQNWPDGISMLHEWKVIDEETRKKYLLLYKLRTYSVHFQKSEQDFEKMSFEAIEIINCIVRRIFGMNEYRKDILIHFEVPGEIFIRKGAELLPIVKAFYIPASHKLGYMYKVESTANPGQYQITDDNEYESKEITDEEFVVLRNNFVSNP